jgi:transcriptional regulator with XRE-family HTH domain
VQTSGDETPLNINLVKVKAGTIDVTFRSRFQMRRRDQQLSQSEVAERMAAVGLPMDATAITRIETGARGIKLAEAWALAAVLGANLADWLPLSLTMEQAIRETEAEIADMESRIAAAQVELGHIVHHREHLVQMLNEALEVEAEGSLLEAERERVNAQIAEIRADLLAKGIDPDGE